MHWAKIYILLKRNLNLPISPDQQDLLGPFRACFKSVLGPDFGPKSPESYLLGKNRTFPDRTQSGLHPYNSYNSKTPDVQITALGALNSAP